MLRSNPHLYEINVRVWMRQLREKYGAALTLSTIPDEEWLELRHLGFDIIWLMGIWQTSPRALELARSMQFLRDRFMKSCPGGSMDDIAASPYSIYDYKLNPELGTETELALVRGKLNGMGMKLFLDFVTNHLAVDHHCIKMCPGCFMQGGPEDVKAHPDWFFEAELEGRKIYHAYGRDPNFPPWMDTAQLNYFHSKTRQEMIKNLLNVAEVCDGVRCDMVMLTLNDVHEGTWGWLLEKNGFKRPEREFWEEAISAVKDKHPHFTFLAEVYWGLEWQLQQMGFDYTYDKVIYDRLRSMASSEIKGHLRAEKLYQKRSARFIENHDEEPAVTAFGRDKSMAAAVAVSTLRGMRFFYDGQLNGINIRRWVQFLCLPPGGDPAIRKFYEKLLKIIDHPAFHGGEWTMLEPRPAAQGDDTNRNFLCWTWNQRRTQKLVVINYSDSWSRCKVPMTAGSAGKSLTIFDELSERFFSFPSEEIRRDGLLVELPPYGSHIFDMEL